MKMWQKDEKFIMGVMGSEYRVQRWEKKKIPKLMWEYFKCIFVNLFKDQEILPEIFLT